MSHKTLLKATQRQYSAEIFSDGLENQILVYFKVLTLMTKGQYSIKSLFLPLEYLGNCRLVTFTFVKCLTMQRSSNTQFSPLKGFKTH